MGKYLVLSTVTDKSTETSTQAEAAAFIAREAGIDDVRELSWQDRHSSLGTERHWEVTGYRWPSDEVPNRGFAAGSVTARPTPPKL